MAVMRDANIAAWQQAHGIQPVAGPRGDFLEGLSRAAYDLIRVVELERSGIRDGDGSWSGSDPLDGTIREITAIGLKLFRTRSPEPEPDGNAE